MSDTTPSSRSQELTPRATNHAHHADYLDQTPTRANANPSEDATERSGATTSTLDSVYDAPKRGPLSKKDIRNKHHRIAPQAVSTPVSDLPPTLDPRAIIKQGTGSRAIAYVKPDALNAARAEYDAQQAADHAALVAEEEAEKAQSVKDIIGLLRTPKEDGGKGLRSFDDFMMLLFESKDPLVSSWATKYSKKHGADLVRHMYERAPEEISEGVLRDVVVPELLAEGIELEKVFGKKGWHETMRKHIREFSVQSWASRVQEVAPKLWTLLSQAFTTEDKAHSPDLIITTIAAMLTILRTRTATRYQTVFGLFLLASGAAKREMEVLAHAGLSVSYSQIIRNVKKLSAECEREYQREMDGWMIQFVWDNINIAFRVGEQRFDNKDHFDSGTTGTFILLYDPDSPDPLKRVKRGTIPLSTKPKLQTRRATFDIDPSTVLIQPEGLVQLSAVSLWQLRRVAIDSIAELERFDERLGAAPEIMQIPVHKTQQYAAPAMKIDESSLDGTASVYETLLKRAKLHSQEALTEHGPILSHGDLLTELLAGKLEGARRNSEGAVESLQPVVPVFGIFHTKMAGGRLSTNHHWGQVNSPDPGGLWWENTTLGRKPMAAGWKGKKSTPWAPSHELLHMSLPAHVVDGIRIHAGVSDVKEWAKNTSYEEFVRITQVVFDELFTTAAVDKLRNLPNDERDIKLENNILYNRDALFYLVFVAAIKRGDIGCVVNVLRVWGVMMRGVSSMPNYADAIFEFLARIESYPERLRNLVLNNWLVNLTGRVDGFKEVDLLQEHQNFWAKVIYTAKGVNKSWEWLSMITVCIYALRDVMRTVQREYKTTDYGLKHKKPDTTAERTKLADKLKEHSLQTYVRNRKLAHKPVPVIDLIHQGNANLDNPKTYQAHIKATRIIKNLGVIQPSTDPTHVPVPPQSPSNSPSDSSRSPSPDLPSRVTTPQPTDALLEDSSNEADDSDSDGLYGVSREDLELDEEEPYGMMDEIVRKLAEAAGDAEADAAQADTDEDVGTDTEGDQVEGDPLSGFTRPFRADSAGSPVGFEADEEEMDAFFDDFFG